MTIKEEVLEKIKPDIENKVHLEPNFILDLTLQEILKKIEEFEKKGIFWIHISGSVGRIDLGYWKQLKKDLFGEQSFSDRKSELEASEKAKGD